MLTRHKNSVQIVTKYRRVVRLACDTLFGPIQSLDGRAKVSGAAPSLPSASAGAPRPPLPPHLRDHGAVRWVQPLEHLLEEVGQGLNQVEQRARRPLHHERPPPRDDAPRDLLATQALSPLAPIPPAPGGSFLRLLASPLGAAFEIRRPSGARGSAPRQGGRRQPPAPRLELERGARYLVGA